MILSVSAFFTILWTALGTNLFALAGLWALRWRHFFLLQRLSVRSEKNTSRPGISIVIPASNAARTLASHLPMLLDQDYPDFEIIVADEATDDETEDLLKVLEKTHLTLRHVSLPKGCAHQSRRRMATTLGIRAARHEWILLTEADCRPATRKWLLRMSEQMTERHDLIVGCATFFDHENKRFTHAAFLRIREQLPWLHSACGGRAALVDSANLAFRRSWFEQAGGYASTLSFPLDYGENSMLAGTHCRKGRCSAVCCHEALVLQDFSGKSQSRKMQKEQRQLVSHLGRSAGRVRFGQRCAAFSAGLFAVSWLLFFSTLTCFFLTRTFSELSFSQLPASGQYGLLTASVLLFGFLFALLGVRLRNRKAVCRLLYGH